MPTYTAGNKETCAERRSGLTNCEREYEDAAKLYGIDTKAILKPLQGRDEKTAIDTLSAYLIDADKNIAAAAKYLHVHESTVKYRLNNIKRKLGYDIAEMPGVYSLYKALALNRLLHARNNIKY